MPAVDRTFHTLAGYGVKFRCRRDLKAARLGACDDRRGQGMFAAALEAGGELQKLVFANAADCSDADEARLAFGEGPGLVDNDGVDLLHQFEGLGVFDEDTGAGAAAGADYD